MAFDVEPIPAELSLDAPDWALELDEAILAGVEVEPDRRERWRIGSDEQAEWAMRKLAFLGIRHQEVAARAVGWRERIDEWERAELKRITPGVAHFRAMLEEYGILERERDESRATVHVPSGEVSTRKPKTAAVIVVDEEAFIEWAEDMLPEYLFAEVVETKRSAKLMSIRKNTEARAALLLICAECGHPVVQRELGWYHNIDDDEGGDADNAYFDGNHEARPTNGYEVVWRADRAVFPEDDEENGGQEIDGLAGVVVSGVSAAVAPVTASVKLAR